MLDGENEPEKIEAFEIPLEKISVNVLDIIRNDERFSQSRVFGTKGLGSPEEYDKLQIIDETGCKTFEYFNKGIYF